MSKTVYCLRHGEVKFPLDEQGRKLVYTKGTPLSEVGRLQIQKAAEQLFKENKQIEAIFTSPYMRTLQTSQILQENLNIHNFFVVANLRDVSPNSWTGRPIEEYKKTGGDVYSHPLSQGQETLKHLLIRANNAIDYACNNFDFDTICIVSHGDLLSGIDWILKKQGKLPSYREMADNFYLEKSQIAVYKINPDLKLVEDPRLITVPEVGLSLEGYRKNFRK